MSSILTLAREKYYFNNKLDFSDIDFQIQLENNEMFNGSNYYINNSFYDDQNSSSSLSQKFIETDVKVKFFNGDQSLSDNFIESVYENGFFKVRFLRGRNSFILKNASGEFEGFECFKVND